MPESSSTAIASPALPAPGCSGGGARPADCEAGWARWVLPSFADIFFLVLTGILALTPAAKALLGDADTGWHIRNGEQILATHLVPQTDPFSYTRAGQPWFAWEWLYDIVIAGIHHFAGLNGVVLFSAMVIAATFALLFRFVLRRSGSFAVAVALTLLAASAAQIHMLARPHVVGWLFTLLWLELLYRYEEGKRTALLWLPPLMLVWVNVHGGFILGLALVALFGCAHLWHAIGGASTGASTGDRRQIGELAAVFLVCCGVTLLTPYGYRLHVHVYEYLSNRYLMNAINEFMSPNFHATGYGYFECFILLAVAGVGWARQRLRAADLLLLLFSIHAGLYAARNIPLAGMMMSLAMGPMWAGILAAAGREGGVPRLLAAVVEPIEEISANMAAMEKRFRGHALALLAVAGCVAVALNGGRIGQAQLMSAHFDAKDFPVKAADYIAAQGIEDHLFNPDSWSGYLIYRLYPHTRLFVDDRHDFYGEAFIKDYLKIKDADWSWPQLLDRYQVRWVLLPPEAPLTAVLKQSRSWRAIYDDGVAVIFQRSAP